jgi:hypothetical protein
LYYRERFKEVIRLGHARRGLGMVSFFTSTEDLVKQQLLRIFLHTPAIAAKGAAFMEDLAEDVQAVIIRALQLKTQDPQLAQLEHDVHDLYVHQFGVQLSNLLFQHYDLTGSMQASVTKAMLQTFQLEHGQGANLKARLKSLAASN